MVKINKIIKKSTCKDNLRIILTRFDADRRSDVEKDGKRLRVSLERCDQMLLPKQQIDKELRVVLQRLDTKASSRRSLRSKLNYPHRRRAVTTNYLRKLSQSQRSSGTPTSALTQNVPSQTSDTSSTVSPVVVSRPTVEEGRRELSVRLERFDLEHAIDSVTDNVVHLSSEIEVEIRKELLVRLERFDFRDAIVSVTDDVVFVSPEIEEEGGRELSVRLERIDLGDAIVSVTDDVVLLSPDDQQQTADDDVNLSVSPQPPSLQLSPPPPPPPPQPSVDSSPAQPSPPLISPYLSSSASYNPSASPSSSSSASTFDSSSSSSSVASPTSSATPPPRRPVRSPVQLEEPPRRRHAVIPHRITYHAAVDAVPEELERMCDAPFFCGNFDDMCRRCGAKFFTKEPKNRAGIRFMCCKNGEVVIPLVHCPPELRTLYTENSERSTEFLANIRVINSLFAMASFKTSAPNRQMASQGRWCFVVCGQIYHFMVGVPTSQELRRPIMSHYYFLDAEEVADRRADFLENRVGRNLLEFVERCLRRHNRYIKAFQTMGEVLKEEADRRGERPVDDVIIAFSRTGDMNVRRRAFDLPESRSEIAAVFYGMEPPFDVDLKLYPRRAVAGEPASERRHELKNLHPMSDPMVYPLLFPFAEDGYSIGLRHGTHKITMREFYRFRIQVRDPFSILHNGGKIFQQYLVDAWVRVEADVLWWIRQHQERFRFAANQILRRAMANDPAHVDRVGRAIVLPSAFPGGPRHMQRMYLDAMAVVARHGKPDLFVTFTCNPNWPEIKNNLEFRQKPENRPDLVCRVFRLKFTEFLDDVVHKQIFGVIQNYHYVIEFQKRGLPHAHAVFTFIPDDRLHTAEQIDEIVSAVIPRVDTQPRLYELVSKYQVHRPCGALNPNASCMEEGRCKKFFPKPYAERTVLGAGTDTRPVYKRPRDNRFIRFPECIITNTRIVPYNPYCLAKFQTHINFEVVGSLATLKYLYKYVTKGPDCVTIYEDESGEGEGTAFRIDEVRNYLDCRYVSSMEAAWRLLEFKMHDRSHAVLVLPVHLPGEHNVVFNEDDDLEELEERLAQRSKLEAWFALNREDRDAREFRYGEIPEHFVWRKSDARWVPRRQQAKMIGCIAEVSPRHPNLELFYLRMLLRHVRGATSFERLRTVDSIVRATFEEACVARNLLSHVDEYDLCLREAALMRHPRQMRRLFGLIICVLTDETIGQIPLLWRQHRDSLVEDFVREGCGRREAQIRCVEEIDRILARNRPELRCAALGIVVEEADDDDDVGVVVGNENVETGLNMDEEIVPALPRYSPVLLNVEQKKIFLRIVQAVSRTTGKILPIDLYDDLGDDVSVEDIAASRPREHLFFVDGPGGTGKTFLYNTLCTYVSSVLGLSVVSVAWTGIAATLLVGGRTVHRAFRLPINLTAASTVGWPLEADESEVLRNVALILWDEAPMTQRYAVEAVDRYLREICRFQRDQPMGGKCCVFGGDFRQVLPVVPKGPRATVIDACIKRLPFWNDFVEVKLAVNVRAARQTAGGGDLHERPLPQLGNRNFEQWLLALGEGRLPHVSFESYPSLPVDLVQIPPLFFSPNLEDLIRFVFPNGFEAEDVGERAVLSPTNAMVEIVNEQILNSLRGETTTFVSVDECKLQDADQLEVPVDLLNSVNVAGLPPHELKLKVGAVVMLLRNLDVEHGECNGARMRVTRLGEHLIECQFLNGVNRGRKSWLPKIKMIARDSIIPQEVIRTQFPVRLAYAMTINKAQGQTLSRVGVYLKRSCFAHGQLYVAFSRVGTSQNVRVCVEEGSKQGSFRHRGGKKFTRNVVYHTILGHCGANGGSRPVPRQIVPRGDIAERAELEEMFGGDRDDHIFQHLELPLELQDGDPRIDIEDAQNVEPIQDPFVDEAGIDLPIDFVPYRTKSELSARVSTTQRAGTTGASLRASFRRPVELSSSSSSDSD